ncbi:MAG: hypothetical protein RIS92_83 [Verrucomicrobiota bacterium]
MRSIVFSLLILIGGELVGAVPAILDGEVKVLRKQQTAGSNGGLGEAHVLKVAAGGSKELKIPSLKVSEMSTEAHNFHRSEAQSQAYLPGAELSLGAVAKFGKNSGGSKYAGYGLQLISGGQVVDSEFSADSLAARVGASRNTPGKKFSGGGKK